MQPIQTALLSFGMSGQVFHAPFLQAHPGFHFHSVWERSRQRAADRYPGVESHRSLSALLAHPDVELVIVNTPNYSHFDYARRALEAGKHVIVEKPFTVTAAEAEELAVLAKARQRVLSVFHNRRFDSDFRTVKQVIEGGSLGELVEAEFHYDRFREELSAKLHKEMPGPGTGALYDLGSHLIDQALHLFGPPQQVGADLRTLRGQSRVDDYFDLLLYYPGLRVRLKGSYLVREPLPAYILHGRQGSFLKSRGDVQEERLQAGEVPGGPGWGVEEEKDRGLLHTGLGEGVVRQTIETLPGNYLDYFTAVYEAVRQGTPAPVTAEEAGRVIRLIEAALLSHREQKVVNFGS